jgi:hypothetical protein
VLARVFLLALILPAADASPPAGFRRFRGKLAIVRNGFVCSLACPEMFLSLTAEAVEILKTVTAAPLTTII